MELDPRRQHDGARDDGPGQWADTDLIDARNPPHTAARQFITQSHQAGKSFAFATPALETPPRTRFECACTGSRISDEDLDQRFEFGVTSGVS